MTTRILKLEDEDVELIGKLVNNIHRRLENDPSDPAVSEHLMSAHRLFEQFQEGLPTELQFVRAFNDADAEQEAKAKEQQAKKRAKRKARLYSEGITAQSSTMDVKEPLPKPKRTKPRRKPSKPKEVTSCVEHKNSGARAPRRDCRDCWAYYKSLHPERYAEAWKKFKEKKKE